MKRAGGPFHEWTWCKPARRPLNSPLSRAQRSRHTNEPRPTHVKGYNEGDRVSVSIEPITESGWYHGVRKPSSLVWGEGFFICEDAEKSRQLRSPRETILDVAQRLRLRLFLACGLAERAF
jgi:hypothetical protein